MTTIDQSATKELKKEHNLTNSTIGLFVGRLGYEKWLPYLIESLEEVIKTHPDFKLVIISPKTKKLYSPHIQEQIYQTEKQIKDNYLSKHILRIDPVEDDTILRNWMAISHIGIIPSMSEGFCYTAVQMEAIGLPLIVSKVWALPEVLSHQHTFISYGHISELIIALQTILVKAKDRTKIIPKLQHKNINFQSYYDIFSLYTKNS